MIGADFERPTLTQTEAVAEFSGALAHARSHGAEYLIGRTLVVDAYGEADRTTVTMDSMHVRFAQSFNQDSGAKVTYRLGSFRWDEASERDSMGVPIALEEPRFMPEVVWVERSGINPNTGVDEKGPVTKLTGDRAQAAVSLLMKRVIENLSSIDESRVPRYWPNRLGVYTPVENRKG